MSSLQTYYRFKLYFQNVDWHNNKKALFIELCHLYVGPFSK